MQYSPLMMQRQMYLYQIKRNRREELQKMLPKNQPLRLILRKRQKQLLRQKRPQLRKTIQKRQTETLNHDSLLTN